jgi:very-short-patch-repair endonuclease
VGNGPLSKDDFIEKSVAIHWDKYDYRESIYVKSNKKVKILCKEHGLFEITPNSHLMGHGCRKCAKNHKYTIEDLNSIFIDIYNDNLKFDFFEYKNIKSKIIVNCKNHSYFETTAELLINGYGCSSCGKISLGEERISKYLLSNNIEYTKQKSFDDCLFVNKLQFDFFIPSKNICIEYDGKQHFEPIEYFGGYESYIAQIKKDSVKNEFCESKKIKLIRIPYYEYENIEKILEKKL